LRREFLGGCATGRDERETQKQQDAEDEIACDAEIPFGHFFPLIIVLDAPSSWQNDLGLPVVERALPGSLSGGRVNGDE